MGEEMIYDKLLCERILIGSYQLMSYWRQMNKWRHHEQRYNFSSDKTNRFYVAEDCIVIDHRRRRNVVRTSVTNRAMFCVLIFFSYHILTQSVIYHWRCMSSIFT